MSAIAEPPAALIDDRLAKRNAVVLAVAQALAGGNNTVIVATAGIIGLVLAPDKSLATLPISVMMFGLWFSTVPMGLMAQLRQAHRAADRRRRRCSVRAGLLRCRSSGVVRAAAARHVRLRFLCRRAYVLSLRVDRHGNRCLQADRDLLRARRRRAGWRDRPFGRDLHQGSLAALSVRRHVHRSGGAGPACGLGAVEAQAPPPMSRAEIDRGRPLGEIVRSPKFIVAVFVGVSSYTLMNLVMTSAPLAMVG